jgi:ubiquinone/menaquinone biosynthesis C-methylase UbiE
VASGLLELRRMYVCPDCKGPLQGLACSACGLEFSAADGFPNFVRRDNRLGPVGEITARYDIIYGEHDAAWEDQGRTPEFISYLSHLAGSLSERRVLEVGCGEGFLLEALTAADKSAVDLSVNALRKSRRRADGTYALALAERLPFPASSFDLVVSVGVMEHFLDEDAATSEIRRVLRPGGHYLTLIHVFLSRRERLRQKLREFVFPRARPGALLRWVSKRMLRPTHQPIKTRYTVASARECLERNGLAVRRTISLASEPAAPLIGPHVVIYIAERQP